MDLRWAKKLMQMIMYLGEYVYEPLAAFEIRLVRLSETTRIGVGQPRLSLWLSVV